MAHKGFREPGEKPKRFYKTVDVRPGEGEYQVLLDGRSPRSARGTKLSAPTETLAQMLAVEWAGQGEFIEIAGMSATRLAFTALEAIPQAREATAQQFADYAGSDLICYFAEAPDTLVQRQTAAWSPILERAARELSLVFQTARGIRHVAQPPLTLTRTRDMALDFDDFGLAGLAFGAPLFGSAILTLGLQRQWFSGAEAHGLSRIDEAYQEEKWGIDEEAAERTARLAADSEMLSRWFAGLNTG